MDKKKRCKKHPQEGPPARNYILTDSVGVVNGIDELSLEIGDYFKPKKEKSIYLRSVYEYMGKHEEASAVRVCGEYLQFGHYKHKILDLEKNKLESAFFCKNRLCPMCSWRRSLKNKAVLGQILPIAVGMGYQFIFLTFTIKNPTGAKLKDTVDLLNKAFSKLYKKVSKKGIDGAIKVLEFTYNEESDTFHPHIHAIFACSGSYFHGNKKNKKTGVITKNYMNINEWRSEWQSCIGSEYLPLVSVKSVYERSDDGIKTIQSKGSVYNAVKEAGKYSVKDSEYLDFNKDIDLSAYLVQTYEIALHHRRLIAYTGIFLQIKQQLGVLDGSEDNDLLHIDKDNIDNFNREYGFLASWFNNNYVVQITD